MGYKLTTEKFNDFLTEIGDEYKIYAPILLKGKGTFSDTDTVRYGQVNHVKEIVFDKKSNFSPKEVILPITQTLFYFTEDSVTEPKTEDKKILIFLRSCDICAVKRLDQIYLDNGAEDPYYKKLREKVKFILMECEDSFENCFCVSMGTNKTEEYDLFVKVKDGQVFVECKDESFKSYFHTCEQYEVSPKFIEANEKEVKVPRNLDTNIFSWSGWKEYSQRCIACGRCNTVWDLCLLYNAGYIL